MKNPVVDTTAYANLHIAPGNVTQLKGWILAVARGAWLVIAALTFILIVASVSAEYERFRVPCIGSDCTFLTLSQADQADLGRMGLSMSAFATYVLLCKATFTGISLFVGTALFWRRSAQPVVLLLALALITIGGTAFSGRLDIYLGAFEQVWQTLALALSFIGNTAIVISFYVFPDGRFVPSWTKAISALFIVMQTDGYLLNSTLFGWLPESANLWILLFFLGSMVGAQIYRYFRVSSTSEKQQIKWVVLGITGTVFGTQFIELVLPQLALPHVPLAILGNGLYFLALLLIPLSIGIAILRYRLWDIDILINRTLVFGTLTALVILLYVVLVRSLSEFLQVSDNPLISLIATGVVAVLFQPLRERLQRGANRLLYGDRDDPYSVLSRLGWRLGETATPEALLPSVVETIAQTLKVPYVEVALKRGNSTETAAYYGKWTADVISLPLVYQGEPVGALAVARRAPGEAFSKGDMGLLQSIAREAGMAAHAVQLTADLQRSREHLVTAREEERRRLRRDLHDGLGPALGGLTLKLDAARNLLPNNPKAVDNLLVELKEQSQAAIADIRRLVYDLRPPALDDLGLASALREYAAQYNSLSGVRIEFDMPSSMPPLPAAVEVAAYRIVQEALNNVVRHARAHSCRIYLAVDRTLDLVIVDDGVGLPPDRRSGIGLHSMRERAEELGGTFSISSTAAGGTRVEATLPMANAKMNRQAKEPEQKQLP